MHTRRAQDPPSGVAETLISKASSPRSHTEPHHLSIYKSSKLFSQSQNKIFLFLSTVLVLSLFMFITSDDEVLLQAQTSSDSQIHNCDGRQIFIYHLPSDFNDLIGMDCANWTFPHWSMCDDILNDGFGKLMNLPASDPAAPLLQPLSAWYKTDQCSLEVIFHHRLKTHPCRTEDPTQASMFYLPCYVALDITRHLFNPDLAIREDLTNRFVTWLRDQEAWQLHQGHRHVLTVGGTIWDVHCMPTSRWESSLLTIPELENVTKLLIERCAQQDTTVAIPYPTNFHPASDTELRSWQATVRNAKRSQLVLFAGSARRWAQPNTTSTVRDELFKQCANLSKCKLVVCTQKLCAENAQTIYKLSLESVFCLHPQGDSYTRKGIFDTLLSGCIPVLFGKTQTVEQYLWHLPGDGSNYSVLLDGDAVVFDYFNVIGHLERIPQAEVRRLQENIVQLLPTLLFRNPRLDGEYSSKDAFDVAIDSLFERFEREEGGLGGTWF